MNKIVMALLVLSYLMLPSCAAFADTAADDAAAGLPPETAKQAMFTPADPDDTGADEVTATDAGLASEEAGEEAYSEAGTEEMDSAMDVGMDY